MASGSLILFSKNKADLRMNDLVGATVKVALVTSSWTPDSSVTGNYLYSDVSSFEIANGNGYTTGGATVITMASTAITNGFKFTSAEVNWTASGGSIPAWRYAVMYVSGTLWSKSSPLVGYFVGDSTPADIPATTDGYALTLACPSPGWYTAT